MELTGKLIEILPTKTGNKDGKEWQSKDFVIETTEQYPKQICINAFGEKSKLLDNCIIGDSLKVSINILSRKFKENWYTQISAWKIENISSQNDIKSMPSQEFSANGGQEINDLPFQ